MYIVEIVVAVIGVLLSIVSAVIAVWAIKHSTKLQNQTITHQDYEDLREWFQNTVYKMKELYIKHPNNKRREELENTLVELAANIDLGRIFFKNKASGDYKINKPEVFRGRRVLVLDVLVLYFDIFFEGLQEENQDMLWCLQRAFISEMIMCLEKNKNSNSFIEYDYIDENDIIDIKNLNNEEFRKVLLSQDIIKAVKERKIIIENENPKKKRTVKSKSN